jgi:hypothetical protein
MASAALHSHLEHFVVPRANEFKGERPVSVRVRMAKVGHFRFRNNYLSGKNGDGAHEQRAHFK